MNRVQVKNLISMILNIAMAVFVAAAIGWYFTDEGLISGAGNMDAGGFGCLRFFTNDSNILAALCSIILIPFNIKAIKSGKNEIPKWALILKLVGATAVTVTFIVVLAFLGPIIGYETMFEGNCFTLHLICPLLSIISFCFFEHGTVLSKKEALFGVLTVAIYGTVYFINVLVTKAWSDFYNFNMGGYWYVSCIVMPAVTYFSALALRTINKITGKA